MARFDHAEFENRLRDLGALGPCLACGSEDADRLEPTPFQWQSAFDAPASLMTYVGICPNCGFIRTFTPEVLKAEEHAG